MFGMHTSTTKGFVNLQMQEVDNVNEFLHHLQMITDWSFGTEQ